MSVFLNFKILKRIYRFHNTLSKTRLFVTAFFVLYLLTILLSVIGNCLQEDALTIEFLEGKDPVWIFVLTVILAPVVETLIFQYGIIELSLKVRSRYTKEMALIVSALVFGIEHGYNTIYIVFATIMGVALAFYYLLFKKYTTGFAIVAIMVLHALLNFISFLLNLLFDVAM
ncbi:CPBP family intramembrane glutamic endopeptidase [Flavobacterium sp. WV_118_3]|uniref:CPBP family intramembrane glutamic endopeptidase n=1 Tax=Flavobacterium sp. WV_118_3 TaxID=3151764 RepID=UPI00321B51F3